MNYLLVFAALLCLAVVNVSAGECRDWDGRCKEDIKYCNSTKRMGDWMKENCALTCGFCTHPTFPPRPPHYGGCGKPDIAGIRVIAGKTAVRGSWPWQILMLYNGQAMCGGTLIAPQWVVTAAHCVYNKERSGAFSVRVGEHDREHWEGTEVDVNVAEVFRHEDYDSRMLNNDIALFRLDKPVTFNDHVSPACLPSKKVPVGSKCYITGWGKTRHPGFMAQYLQQGLLPVVSNQVCYEKNKQVIPIQITDGMICGGSGGTARTSGCHGDSGGPFVCNVDGVWELHGSVSHGSPVCESTQAFTVFSRTYHFLDWIHDKMAAY